MRRFATSPQIFILSVVVVLYSLAFNRYVPPQNGDDISYYHGALSIAAGDGFKEQGKWIVDWPPVQSCMVALAMLVSGSREYFVAKVVNGCAVLASLLLAYRFMVSEKRLQPTLSCILIAVFPTSLCVGGAGQADFSYFVLSMIFFLLVASLRVHRSLSIAILCGVVLGCASLTRWQGVMLGVCLAFQFFELAWKSKSASLIQRLLPGWYEVLASTVGCSIFIAWKLWLEYCIQQGTASISNYQYHGSSIWSLPQPIELFKQFVNLLTQLENVVLTAAPSLSWLFLAVVWLFFGITVWGFILRIRRYGWLATDVFFVASCLLLASYAYKETRYGIPLAPFLLDYFFRGLSDIYMRLIERIRASQQTQVALPRLFFGLWIVGLLSFDSILLFYGDGESMGPSSQLLLSDNESYLRGYHRDLYNVCKQLSSQYPHAIVATDKFHKQLVRHYSGLEAHFVGYAPDEKFKVFIQVDPACLPKRIDDLTKSEFELPPSLQGRLSNPRKSGYVTLWDVDAETKP